MTLSMRSNMQYSDNVFIIAEAGVNHNGSLEHALKLVDVAVEAGCDAVKFQTFNADKLTSVNAKKANYQVANTPDESQQDMLRKLELSTADYVKLKNKCDDVGVEFMSTAFDVESLKFLIDDIGIKRIKIPSGEILSGPLLLAAARSGLPVILSTGMSVMQEVFYAISVFAWAEEHSYGVPESNEVLKVYADPQSWSTKLKSRLTLLHCVSQYPAEPRYVNLRAMDYMRELTDLPVGLSDHTNGTMIAVAAVGRDATVIEKHFTLSRHLPGPDHKASLEPHELCDMARSIRVVSEALGTKFKSPQPPEEEIREVARGSLVAERDIALTEDFTEVNLAIKRPGTGVSAQEYWDYLNRSNTQRNYLKDELIVKEDLCTS